MLSSLGQGQVENDDFVPLTSRQTTSQGRKPLVRTRIIRAQRLIMAAVGDGVASGRATDLDGRDGYGLRRSNAQPCDLALGFTHWASGQ